MNALSERIVLKDSTCPLIRLDKARRSDKSVSFSISLCLHALIFILVGVSFVKPPQFGVERGLASIEVELTADKSEVPIPATVEEVVKQADDVIKKEEIKKAPVIVQSTGGAITEAKPDYLKNPAPAYPEAARRQSQEGVVILLAFINTNGFPVKVEVDKGSGFSLLDQAAVKAVRKWRFRPAMFGGIAVESSVRVPIRFNLFKN
jgi:protein TonB